MQTRVFILSLVVVVAIFLGVTITVKQTNDPVMRRLVDQQSQILHLQQKIERMLTAGDKTIPGAQGPGLEQKVELIDKKMDALVGLLRAAGGPQQAAQAPQPPSEEYTKVHDIDIGNSPVKGNKDAPVTIVEFMDYQCPFCARFHPALNEVLEAYPDKVRVVMKNFPLNFHPAARPAAKAAMAAGEQGKYFEMADLLLAHNKSLNEETFEKLAKQIGLDVDRFMSDYKNKDAEYEKIINNDMALGQQVEVRGTPTYYINGRKTRARDFNSYKREIDAILNK